MRIALYPAQRLLIPVLVLSIPALGFGQVSGQSTDLVNVTVRLSNPKSTATGFILSRPAKTEGAGQFLLMTAAHVLEKAEGDEMSIIFRRRNADGDFARVPAPLKGPALKKPIRIALARMPSDMTADSAVLATASGSPGLSPAHLVTGQSCTCR